MLRPFLRYRTAATKSGTDRGGLSNVFPTSSNDRDYFDCDAVVGVLEIIHCLERLDLLIDSAADVALLAVSSSLYGDSAMIPNLLNALLGIWLVYAIVLNPDLINAPWRVVVIAIVIFAMALWARRSDYSPWQNSTNVVSALLLLLIGLLKFSPYISPLVNFWTVFWVGILVAILALWAAIYHPSGDRSKA